MPQAPRIMILQRVVPHYRAPLFEALHERFGWRVAAAANPPPGTGLKLVLEAPYLDTFRFRHMPGRNAYRSLVPVSEMLTTLRPDVVLAEFALGLSSTYELLVRRRFGHGPRTVFWSHGLNRNRLAGRPVDRLIQSLRITLLRRADGNLVYDERGREELRDARLETPIWVAPNTMIVSGPVPPCANAGPPHLLAIGRFTPDKEFPRLIRIFRRFRARFPDARLTLIGDGPQADEIRREVSVEPGGIELAGPVFDDRDLARRFASADLLVITGAAGLAVNHALLNGVPVLAFAGEGGTPPHHPEVAYIREDETGWFVHPHRDDAFVDRLCTLFAHPSRPRERLAKGITSVTDAELGLPVMIEGFRRMAADLAAGSK